MEVQGEVPKTATKDGSTVESFDNHRTFSLFKWGTPYVLVDIEDLAQHLTDEPKAERGLPQIAEGRNHWSGGVEGRTPRCVAEKTKVDVK